MPDQADGGGRRRAAGSENGHHLTAEFSPDSGRWSGEDLHMSQTAPVVVTHPAMRERAWFNSVVNLNVLGIEPKKVRDAMHMLPGDEPPTNTIYGSGELIEPDVLEMIRQAYAGEAIRFDWQKGDLLLIDNVLTAHAREPFNGDRKVVVGMGSALWKMQVLPLSATTCLSAPTADGGSPMTD